MVQFILILDIFRRKHTYLIPVFFKKKIKWARERYVFGGKNHEKCKKRRRQYSFFWIFNIFCQKHIALMPVKKKSNGHQSRMVLAKTSNFSMTNNESPLIFSLFFYELRSGGCWARLVCGKYRRILQKKTSILYNIFDYLWTFFIKTQCCYACIFQKNAMGMTLTCFWRKI